jgi:hypothetical protein
MFADMPLSGANPRRMGSGVSSVISSVAGIYLFLIRSVISSVAGIYLLLIRSVPSSVRDRYPLFIRSAVSSIRGRYPLLISSAMLGLPFFVCGVMLCVATPALMTQPVCCVFVFAERVVRLVPTAFGASLGWFCHFAALAKQW